MLLISALLTARKIIENGQVIIVKGDARYNIMGQPVR